MPADAPQLRPFADLLNSKADLQTVTATIHDLVAVSFISHPVRHRTQAEVKRRAEVVLSAFGAMRKQKGFSQARALAMLPYALKHALENPGKAWEPPKERLYRVG